MHLSKINALRGAYILNDSLLFRTFDYLNKVVNLIREITQDANIYSASKSNNPKHRSNYFRFKRAFGYKADSKNDTR